MATLMQASHQWMSRPADERFLSLPEMHERQLYVRQHSQGQVVSSRKLTAAPVEGDHKALVLVGPNGNPANLTHWSFGQLAQRAGAPAGYLRSIPAPLAADCINYGLQVERDVEDLGVMLYKNGGPAELRAVTGPNYGRIWNSDITRSLMDRFGDGVTGDFKVPGEFGRDVPITRQNTTLYSSDRDMFIFLADEKHRIEVPNRRDGQSGEMARGFFVWNSEVGNTTLGIATFLFDYVCCNRIVWGATGFQEIRIRHTASAPDKWVEEVAPAIHAYAEASTEGIVRRLEQAKAKRIDDIDAFLLSRFTRGQTTAIKAAHMADEQRPIETVWDAATGITAYARGITYQDERVGVERVAGKILEAV